MTTTCPGSHDCHVHRPVIARCPGGYCVIAGIATHTGLHEHRFTRLPGVPVRWTSAGTTGVQRLMAWPGQITSTDIALYCAQWQVCKPECAYHLPDLAELSPPMLHVPVHHYTTGRLSETDGARGPAVSSSEQLADDKLLAENVFGGLGGSCTPATSSRTITPYPHLAISSRWRNSHSTTELPATSAQTAKLHTVLQIQRGCSLGDIRSNYGVSVTKHLRLFCVNFCVGLPLFAVATFRT